MHVFCRLISREDSTTFSFKFSDEIKDNETKTTKFFVKRILSIDVFRSCWQILLGFTKYMMYRKSVLLSNITTERDLGRRPKERFLLGTQILLVPASRSHYRLKTSHHYSTTSSPQDKKSKTEGSIKKPKA